MTRCECGEWTGERCGWTGPRADTMVVGYMPEYLRESHEAARNSGQYPVNGAVRVRVAQSCGEDEIAREPEWAEAVRS